jgi:crotonobetainyl-CoA:carnitine CoA-transferase CaiB-like acyl-CoA transferase
MNLSLYPINDVREIREDKQLGHRKFWVELEHPELNDTIRYPGAFAVFSETPANIHRRAPLIGEHNEEVFADDLGLSKDDLVMLKQASVI